MDQAGLDSGQYEGTVTVLRSEAAATPISVPIRLLVVDKLYMSYLPLTLSP